MKACKKIMTQGKNTNKLKMLKKIRTCRVVLHDIALDANLISFYQLNLSKKNNKELEQSLYINTFKNSKNVQDLTKNAKKDRITKKHSKNVNKKLRQEKCKNKSQLNNQNIQTNKDILLNNQYDEVIQSKVPIQKQRQTRSNATKSTDETSNTSSYPVSSITSIYPKKMVTSINNETHCSVGKPNVKKKSKLTCKRKLNFNEPDVTYDINMESTKAGPGNINYLNKKNLTLIDYDNEIPEVSSDSVQTECDINMYGIINETNYELQQKQNENSKVVSSNIGVENKISINRIAENIKASSESSVSSESSYFSDNLPSTYNNNNNNMSKRQNAKTRLTNYTTSTTDNIVQAANISESFSSNLKSISSPVSASKANHVILTLSDLKTCNNEKSASNKIMTKQKLPKITSDNILPQGTIKILKIKRTNTLQDNVPKQNKCDSSNRNKKTSHVDDTVETINILKEKEYHTSPEINGLIDSLNVPKSTLAFNSNNNFIVENVPNNRFHDKVINRRNLSSLMKSKNNINIDDVNNETSITHKKCTLGNLVQSIRLDGSNEMHETNLLQDSRRHKEISCNDILNMNTSNLIDDNKNHNNSKALISINKEEIVKQNQKRIAEENLKDINLNNKKVKLNRDSWQQNVTSIRLKRHQQLDDFPSTDTTVTIDSNIIFKDEGHNSKKKIDLRERLNEKRLKVTHKLESANNGFENNNNETSEVFKQTDLNKTNDRFTITNIVQDNGFDEKLSVKKKLTSNKTFEEEDNIQLDPVYNNLLHLQSTLEETENINQIDIDIHKDTNVEKEHANNVTDNKDDDDCISLFANESFDVTLCEDPLLHEEDKLHKSQHTDIPYIMSNSSIDKYIKQNTNEFNKEYAECVENSIEMSNTSNETRGECNNQWETSSTNVPTTATKLTTLRTENIEIRINEMNINKIFMGYCFPILRRNVCNKEQCRFKHDLQNLINAVNSENSTLIIKIIQNALYLNYHFFSEKLYVASLKKLTVNQILVTYQSFNIRDVRMELSSKKYVIHNIIRELLNRQVSLKIIVENLVAYILPTNNLQELKNILTSVERYIKPGEYWNTAKTLILKLQPDVHIINKVLLECVENKNLLNIQDVNDNLISKFRPAEISTLNEHLMKCFNTLLTEKTTDDSQPATFAQNFGESLTIAETIASPDSNQSTRSQIESPRSDTIFINEVNANEIENCTTQEITTTTKSYMLQPIDNLPDARSIYRDHENLWKFFVDLDRFKKGLVHKDYDYVVNILKNYSEKQDESLLFFRSCRNILRTEVKRSEYHLANIIRRTVQMGTFSVLSKILFDMTSDILISLMNQEAWVLALWLIQSINTYDLPYNAEFFLLSTGVYLADEKVIEAYDLLKNKNIICTNRAKWYVESTINDEYARSKIIYILLDSFCKEFFEHAFFLFQFLLKDQSSQYFPIDLSRYVDKLIMLSLLQKDTNLITEMGNLILRHDFALHTTTCRALISTLVHIDEILARQIYNYAEGIGIYSAVKLWPIMYVVINTDLTEEEIYLTFLQVLKNLLISFGHTIEFAKPQQIKAYVVLEIKSETEPFHCAELQSYYNNRIIVNRKTLIKNVLKKRFDPPILFSQSRRGRICRLQSTSLINYLKSEHCN